MVSIIDSNVTALIGLALDGTVMRHQVIAHNIANANTPGYRPVGISFDEQLAAARDALSAHKGNSSDVTADFRPTIEFLESNGIGESSVSLDTEVAKLSENTLHQQALLKALNRHFSILDAAINEGKR